MRKLVPLIGIGFLLGGLLAWVLLSPESRENVFTEGAALLSWDVEQEDTETREVIPRVGGIAPDFELSTYDNRTIRLSDLRGSPVLINFWATWCGPCRIEMPAIQSKFVEHTPDLKVLAVNFDESAGEVEEFARDLELNFDLLLDPGGDVNEKDYLVRAYPSSFFVDRDGVIQVVHLGLMTEDQLDDYLNRVGIE